MDPFWVRPSSPCNGRCFRGDYQDRPPRWSVGTSASVPLAYLGLRMQIIVLFVPRYQQALDLFVRWRPHIMAPFAHGVTPDPLEWSIPLLVLILVLDWRCFDNIFRKGGGCVLPHACDSSQILCDNRKDEQWSEKNKLPWCYGTGAMWSRAQHEIHESAKQNLTPTSQYHKTKSLANLFQRGNPYSCQQNVLGVDELTERKTDWW